MWRNAVARGWVEHERFHPMHHKFRYSAGFLLHDLCNLPALDATSRLFSSNRFNLIQFRRNDYLGDAKTPLHTAVQDTASQALGYHCHDHVFLLSMPRMWGHSFNPVSFYFLVDRQSAQLNAIVAEITNTPWDQRHSYVLDARQQTGPNYDFRFSKTFHVSPLLPMDMDYHWRFLVRDDHLGVVMHVNRNQQQVFSARMALKLETASAANLTRLAWRYPWQSLAKLRAIYWQALILRLKGARFYPHPETNQT